MKLNSILFPAPKCSYSIELLEDELIWVPKCENKQDAKKPELRLSAVNGEILMTKTENGFNVSYSGQKTKIKAPNKEDLVILPSSHNEICLETESKEKDLLLRCQETKEYLLRTDENFDDFNSQLAAEDQDEFDLIGIDECVHESLVTSPMSLRNYLTKTFRNPIRKPVKESKSQQMPAPKQSIIHDDNPHHIPDTLPTPRQFPFPSSLSRPYLSNRHLQADVIEPAINLKESEPESLSKKDPSSPESALQHIPCLLLRPLEPSDKIIVHFHGNGEDLYMVYELLVHLRNHLDVNVLAVEYPGYGLYQGTPDDKVIKEDAEAVYDYIRNELKVKPKNIIIFGRSIGSGPATHLASVRQVAALILMSAFTSFRDVVRDFAGRLARYLVKDRFNNLKAIAQVACPVFLIHGQKDKLIPFTHSEKLHRACPGASELLLPKHMDHVEFDFYEDFIRPLMKFLQRCHITTIRKPEFGISFPIDLFTTPELVLKTLQKDEKFILYENLDESIEIEAEVSLDVS